nr:MAG TPA: hypothetical protein [Caudoviricetes sp.]
MYPQFQIIDNNSRTASNTNHWKSRYPCPTVKCRP